ncbi:MAG: response regulator [Candidatus Omnitrophica bacterium]|nr:response regulator [Candidatus Omnitrophota bacterium]
MDKKRVMIIDDEEGFALMLRVRLERVGNYEVMILTDAKDAIKHVHDFQPDVILLDLIMPKVNGLEARDILGSDPVAKDVPVIIVSGIDQSMDKSQAYKFGAVDYIVKPVDDARLLDAVEKAINPSSGQS